MYEDDYFNPTIPNDYNDDVKEDAITKALKREDRGLNTIIRQVRMDSGKIKNKRIKIFTSGDIGTRIRDAETGEYYPNLVGSVDEDIFFKVSYATGDCNSLNGSNTLFYMSPQHFESCLYSTVDPKQIAMWEAKRDARLNEMNKRNKSKSETVVVN